MILNGKHRGSFCVLYYFAKPLNYEIHQSRPVKLLPVNFSKLSPELRPEFVFKLILNFNQCGTRFYEVVHISDKRAFLQFANSRIFPLVH